MLYIINPQSAFNRYIFIGEIDGAPVIACFEYRFSIIRFRCREAKSFDTDTEESPRRHFKPWQKILFFDTTEDKDN